MLKLYKNEKGVVSIAMAILIPVIIIGVLYVYAMLDKPQQENTVHKIVYASSEAYLSRYNAYLFNQMGMLTNLDSGKLEPTILHYLVRNKLLESSDAANLEINYEHLNVPRTYNAAIDEASNILIGNAILDYGVDLLDQFSFAEQIRVLNQSINNYEKNLSEQFDKSGATQFLRAINQCGEVQSGKRALNKLEDYLNKQYETYFKTIEGIKSELARVEAATSNSEQSMIAFIEAKEAQWRDSKASFLSLHQDYLQKISKIDTIFECIESEEASARKLANQLDDEKSQKIIDSEAVSRLEMLSSDIEESIEGYYSDIDAIVSALLDLEASNTTSVISMLRDVILEAEYLFSGIEVGSGELILEETYKHSNNYSDNHNINTVTLPHKVKLNEYYLSIFSSYDLNCPRVFDPQNRHKTLRTIKGEVEYLISGLTNEKQSVSFVRLKIVAIRSAANIVTILCDKDKLSRISTATVALPQPWRSIAYGIAIATWSGLESYSDINRLMRGEGFYFIKSKSQWALDFDALFDGTWKSKVNSASTTIKNNEIPPYVKNGKQLNSNNQISNVMDPNMYYLDYLRLLLLTQSEEMTLLRTMDLVESELLGVSNGKTSLVNFSRGHVINLTWKPQSFFGLLSYDYSTIQMRNGFE